MSNPFHMPTDEEVFALRDEEQQRKRQERERARELHVWEKGVTRRSIKEQPAEEEPPSKLNLVTAATRDRRKEKENMADFIAKKREMFLVQMSLDTKRAEIRKLEERAQQREEALRKSEQMLEEDALRFDQFLKDNDQKAVQAIKKAEAETKAKAEKVQEIKKLNAQITQIKSEMSKFEEQLEDCRKYKDFLDKLTPPEWFEEQEAARLRRKEARKVRKLAERQKALDAKYAAAAAAEAEAEAERNRRGRRNRNNKQAEEEKEKEKVAATAPVLTLKDISDDEGLDEDEDVPMYFQDPQQLLDIFTALEESNLFLIQNSQETEEALEELKAKFLETRQRMEAESAGLKHQIDALKGSIKVEEDKGRALLDRAGKNTGVQAQERTLDELNKKVAEVYRAIFSEADNSLGTLQMLTNIEARLEELLSIIDVMPKEDVEAQEKQKEKERRQRVREAKQALAAKLQEERIQRSIRRSQEPVHRRVGKPIMFRSQPIQRKKKAVDDSEKKVDEEDDVNFYLQLA
mmetsp:Transcript_38299/g.87709  ORF Transcript_38299/g.87709 Transcript_38299/m.87709 type:complete len:519 (-) Transcript_38299:284-1840(-)